MSEDINVTDGTVLECLNNKVDLDGGNYVGSPLETYIHEHCAGTGLDGKITNCITEVPQRIKYVLENGNFTVKAGSVVIVPYGTVDKSAEFPVGADFINADLKVVDTSYADGKFFVWAELQRDIIDSEASSDTLSRYVEVYIGSSSTGVIHLASTSAGTNSASYSGMYYRTDLNTFMRYNSGVSAGIYASLPIGIAVAGNSYIYNSFSVFAGMGYINNVFWVDKGVKGFVGNGRNENGAYQNILYTTSKMFVKTFNLTANRNFYFSLELSNNDSYVSADTLVLDDTRIVYKQTFSPDLSLNRFKWFDTFNNKIFYHDSSLDAFKNYYQVKDLVLGKISINSSSVVSRFEPRPVFGCEDVWLNDTVSGVSNFGVEINIATGWTAISDGVVHFEGYSNSSNVTFTAWFDGLRVYQNTQTGSNANGHTIGVTIPVREGQVITFEGSGKQFAIFRPYV